MKVDSIWTKIMFILKIRGEFGNRLKIPLDSGDDLTQSFLGGQKVDTCKGMGILRSGVEKE